MAHTPYVPFLLAKLLIGTFSGVADEILSSRGERHSKPCVVRRPTATVAPVGIALRRFIRGPGKRAAKVKFSSAQTCRFGIFVPIG